MSDLGTTTITVEARTDKLQRDLDEAKGKATRAAGEISDEVEDRISSRFGKGLKIAGAAAGVAAGAAAVVGFAGALEREQAGANLAASLGLDGPAAAKAGDVAGKLYAANFGDSVSVAGDAVAAVIQGGLVGMDAGAKAIESITAKTITFADVFRQDLGESVGAVSALLLNGLVPDAATALDMLTVTMQRVPERMRGEVLSALNEYSVFFGQLGISGESAMAGLARAAQGGTIAIDKTGDALKELVIRVQDGSSTTSEALTALGLDVNGIAQGFAAGGDSARSALSEIIRALGEMADPVRQTQIGVALLGTPFEDLGRDAIPTLQALTAGLDDTSGAAQRMVDQVSGTNSARLASFRRSMEENVSGVVGAAIGVLDRLPGPVSTAVALFAGFAPVLAPIGAIVAPLVPMLFAQAGAHAAAGTAAAGSAVGFGAAAAGLWAMVAPIAPFVLAIGVLVGAGVLLVKNWDTVLAVGGAVFGWIGDRAPQLVGLLKVALLAMLGPIGLVIAHWGSLRDAAGGAIGWIGDKLAGLVDFVTSIPGRIGGALSGLAASMAGPFKAGLNGIIGLLNRFIDIALAPLKLLDAIPGVGRIIPDIPRIPTLDTGGVVSRPTLALLAANSRPEVVAPLDSLGSLGGGGDPPSTTIINIGGSVVTERQLADTLTRYQRRDDRRNGAA